MKSASWRRPGKRLGKRPGTEWLHGIEGDKLEVFEKDGMICFMPVSVYPKSYVDELKAEILSVKANIKAGKQPVFDNIDAMFEKLEEK